MAWTTLDFTAFQTLTATHLDQMYANMAGLKDGTLFDAGAIKPVHLASGQSSSTWAWQSYTPAWTGGSPSIGNGTLSGYYSRKGKSVFCRILMAAGSTTTFGSGGWSFSLPFTATALAGASANLLLPVGMCYVADSGVNGYPGIVVLNTTTTVTPSVFATIAGTNPVFVEHGNRSVRSDTPMAWGNNDAINMNFYYEAA